MDVCLHLFQPHTNFYASLSFSFSLPLHLRQIPATKMQASLDEGLPILQAEDSYKKFVKDLESQNGLNIYEKGIAKKLLDHPECLSELTKRNKSYMEKLNYQFLELDSKEKFFRYLNQGSILKKDEMLQISKENEELERQVNKQQSEIEALNAQLDGKSDKVIRILVKECKKRNETTRGMEEEVNRLEAEKLHLEQVIAGLNTGNEPNSDLFVGKGRSELEKMRSDEILHTKQLQEMLEEAKRADVDIEQRKRRAQEKQQRLKEEVARLEKELKQEPAKQDNEHLKEREQLKLKYRLLVRLVRMMGRVGNGVAKGV